MVTESVKISLKFMRDLSCASVPKLSVWLLLASLAQAVVGEPAGDPRSVEFNNTRNTRDLGGYVGEGGRAVKWGVLYRSDSLASLDQDDLAVLASLQLATVTDFRGDNERADAPTRLPESTPAIAYNTLALNNPAVNIKKLGRRFYSGEMDEAELKALLDRRMYITDTNISRQWGDWLRSLAQPGALPQLFHCTAGKDRTGYAAAIVLLTLGVSRDDVMSDFMLTNQYLEERIEEGVIKIQANSKAEIDPQLLRDMLGVSPASLNGAIAEMEKVYGSVDGYIEHGLGIDPGIRTRLQSLLLQ